MPNWCNFELRVKGGKNDKEEFLKLFTDDYKGGFARTEFYETPEEILEDNETTCLYGECAWSVYSCWINGYPQHNFNKSFLKKRDALEDYFRVTMSSVCKELHLHVQVASEEPGCCFNEFYEWDSEGNLITDECITPEEIYSDFPKWKDEWDEADKYREEIYVYEIQVNDCYARIFEKFTI